MAVLRARCKQICCTPNAMYYPYNVPPEHTATARQLLGTGPLLCPEQAVVLETNPAKARKLGKSQGIFSSLSHATQLYERLGRSGRNSQPSSCSSIGRGRSRLHSGTHGKSQLASFAGMARACQCANRTGMRLACDCPWLIC